ncbi:DUF1800 family protein [Cellulophaga sp. Hel_I_12]|uniref:DUF1800 domain-containing protein n=1 Tax=Cellulophaga sp. Hel_I_12 TaxID=1249972 RepID=UPI000648DF6A|nr:DUF1800 domain-containing protein [Cellulophaga sp. Hel_I_12]
MEYFINCNTSPLAEYTTPLDRQKIQHLYRRLGFSASVATVNQAVGSTASALVNTLINEAVNMPILPAPPWANWTGANYPEDDDLRNSTINTQVRGITLDYAKSLLVDNLRDRLSFFWSNHFVTELRVYDAPPFLYEYITCLQRNAIGNFKTFISEIGLTNAMLFYLDGAYNNNNRPNENYGRELYELFTLGEGNGYTEQDIVDTARALTGYVERGEIRWTPVTFRADRFDAGSKTILGITDNFDYDGVIDNLFAQRNTEIATFICKKLYEFFVHPDSTDQAGNAETIINGMAATFVANNFEIAPVLSQLFTSQHFFDEEAIGVVIKSPFDCFLNLINETGFTASDTTIETVINYSDQLSQELFNPVDVAGWQRNRSWINTNFLIGRWLSAEALLEVFWNEDKEQFRTFGIEVTGPQGATTHNPDMVARAIIDKILPKGLLTEQDYTTAIVSFRALYEDNNIYEDENPTNPTWTMLNFDNTPEQVYLLLLYLVRQPEFQLK